MFRPEFSAEHYASARPRYPPELFAYLASLLESRQLAWDCATGTGQAASMLVDYFEHVVATDVSTTQLARATAHPHIAYHIASAEESGLDSETVDLVTVAAAVHWFNLDRFYAEAMRVLRPGGVIAVWTYHVGRTDAPVGKAFDRLYRSLRPYFGDRVILVDECYEGIELPGEPIETPEFVARVEWSLDQARSFVRSWSGTKAYVERHGEDLLERIDAELRSMWGAAGRQRRLAWPLYLRTARKADRHAAIGR